MNPQANTPGTAQGTARNRYRRVTGNRVPPRSGEPVPTPRCGHGREGTAVRTCPACAMRIRPDHYWALIRELNAWRKKRRTPRKEAA